MTGFVVFLKVYIYIYPIVLFTKGDEMVAWKRGSVRNCLDLHQVVKYLQRALLLRTSFTGNWYGITSRVNLLCSLLTAHPLLGVENFCGYKFFVRLRILQTQFMSHLNCSLFTLQHICWSCFDIPQTIRLIKGQFVILGYNTEEGTKTLWCVKTLRRCWWQSSH